MEISDGNHFDVIIVGAGLSGIGAACHLQKHCPTKSFALLEGRQSSGGTWDLFRYPGVRSDSDMYTLGYNFKPWTAGKAIADGPSILSYIKEAADENGINDHIRFGHKVVSAEWSSNSASWKLATKIQKGDDSLPSETRTFTSNMLLLCGGYYNYDQGYTPDFKDIDKFSGQLLHPQKWPEDLDYHNKKVVIIGSGATAMTLVPAMALSGAEQVTMIQRSPTYVISMPDEDKIANGLQKILPKRLAYACTRWKNIGFQSFFYKRAINKPEQVKGKLLAMIRKYLPKDYVEEHFTPSYNPWQERLCLIPNADLFKAINRKKAQVITDQIDCFVEDGLKMASGKRVPADIVVTATGLNLLPLNGLSFVVDGKEMNPPDLITYKGMMYSSLPNLVHVFGYVNASWTLRADLTAEWLCRLVNHMDKLGMRQCTPTRNLATKTDTSPWIANFNPGYMKRAMHLFPKQGAEEPWVNTQNYTKDKKMLREGSLEDDALEFSNPLTGEDSGAVVVNEETTAAMKQAGTG